MRIAVIDMGTNTFHLLIAEETGGSVRILHREYLATRMGQGGINRNEITAEALTRVLDGMQHFRTVIDQWGATQVQAFGTSALRNAANQQEVCRRIEELTYIPVAVISGDAEATYIYEGIRSAMDLGEEPNLMVDIGGGSVEFIIGNRHGIAWKQSIEVGGQRLLEKFYRHDPLLPEDTHRVESYLTEMLEPVLGALREYQPRTLVGSAGSFDTLSEMHCLRAGIPYPATLAETPLTIAGFYDCYHDFLRLNHDARLQLPGMLAMRADMIVMAVILIDVLMKAHPFSNLRVSTYSLKEGALAVLARQR